MKNNPIIIDLKNISVSFENQKILNNINLYIRDGEFLTLLGPSGCGKTTTLRIIAGFLQQDSGDVIFEGKNINGVPAYKRQVNTIFQRYALFPHLNVYENIAFGLRLKKWKEDAIQEKVSEMLTLVNLKGFGSRKIDSLSGGQQQRVAIARALAVNPRVVLLDEPLGALDLKLRKDMQIELKRIQKMTKKTFVYVTHDQEEALTMSDRVVVMNNGVIEQIGTPIDIYNEPANAFVADFIGEANILNATMVEDYKVNILGTDFKCTDAGFGKNKPVDVVIRPEDILVVPVENGIISGKVVNTVFKGVHYEMEVKCKNCTLLIHSTASQNVGETIGMYVTPDNIHIMNKLFPTPYNEFEAVVSSSDEEENTTTIIIEGKEVEIKDRYFEKDAKLHIILPPTGIYVAGDGVGQIDDVFIESVIWKGEYNEIIVESDERKWLMHSAQDEQVATYAPICFDFKDAVITLAETSEGENEV